MCVWIVMMDDNAQSVCVWIVMMDDNARLSEICVWKRNLQDIKKEIMHLSCFSSNLHGVNIPWDSKWFWSLTKRISFDNRHDWELRQLIEAIDRRISHNSITLTISLLLNDMRERNWEFLFMDAWKNFGIFIHGKILWGRHNQRLSFLQAQ